MGALPRLRLRPEAPHPQSDAPAPLATQKKRSPRWPYVMGLALYCAVFWGVIWLIGGAMLNWAQAQAPAALF
jgi:hypothetical protein